MIEECKAAMKALHFQDTAYLVIGFILLTNIAIIFNLPYLRIITGFIFLAFLPGFLIIHILRLNRLTWTEKYIFTVGLSLSFVILLGFIENIILLNLGYPRPLDAIPLLIYFDFLYIFLLYLSAKSLRNIQFKSLSLDFSEKLALIGAILLPALSFFGTYILNCCGFNQILIFTVILISLYFLIASTLGQIIYKNIYSFVLLFISISLILIFSLRSNHIIGIDRHIEYFYFRATLLNSFWSILDSSNLGSCLSVSLLHTIYNSFLLCNSETLFKILIPILVTTIPLIIYALSQNYINKLYSFIVSFAFISQYAFLNYPGGRTKFAVLFFALALLSLFSKNIGILQKRILAIIFIIICVLTHYATTYIAFIILSSALVISLLLTIKFQFMRHINYMYILIFLVFLFLWNSLVAGVPFESGIVFISSIFKMFDRFFLADARSIETQLLMGSGIAELSIPYKFEFLTTWILFFFIAIGISFSIINYKKILSFKSGVSKAMFLKNKIDIEYFLLALISSLLLLATIILPYISKGYGIDRIFYLTYIVLSTFLLIGGLVFSEKLSFYLIRLFSMSKSKSSYYIIQNIKIISMHNHVLLVLIIILYFGCTSGLLYEVFGSPRSITLSSQGTQYDMLFISDKESESAIWLEEYYNQSKEVFTDFWGYDILISQAQFPLAMVDRRSLIENKSINGYIFLRYYNLNKNALLNRDGYNVTLKNFELINNTIYYNGGAKILI